MNVNLKNHLRFTLVISLFFLGLLKQKVDENPVRIIQKSHGVILTNLLLCNIYKLNKKC